MKYVVTVANHYYPSIYVVDKEQDQDLMKVVKVLSEGIAEYEREPCEFPFQVFECEDTILTTVDWEYIEPYLEGEVKFL